MVRNLAAGPRACVAVILTAAGALYCCTRTANSAPEAPPSAVNDLTKVAVQFDVSGVLKLNQAGENKELPLSVHAKFDYAERVMALDAQDLPQRSTRYYRQAEARIKVGSDPSTSQLRSDRRLVVAEIVDNAARLFSPAGPLTRDELDLIAVMGNSLTADRFLPKNAVVTGQTWEPAGEDLAIWLGIDAVARSDVKVKCAQVTAATVELGLSGNVQGAIEGVATDIDVEGSLTYSRETRRVTAVKITVQERRAIGHVHPGLDVKAELSMQMTPVAEVADLSDASLADLPLEASDESLLVECAAASGKFRLHHDRRWHIMGDEPESMALRFVDRGELVAQCNISPLPPADPKNPPTLEKFQEDVRRTLDKNFSQFVEAQEGTLEGGRRIYRVVAAGAVEDVAIRWHYYLVQDEQGRMAALSFTAEEEMEPRLVEADQPLVATFELLDVSKTTARLLAPPAKIRR